LRAAVFGHTRAVVENLTHSLVGLLCAEVAVRIRDRRRALAAWPRAAAYAIAIIGNNAPDIDFTYAGISGKRFGYLLQHRGYTHTLPAAFGFALLMLGVLWALGKWRKKSMPSEDWWLLASLALLSPLLHIAMDFANNYGVHPFWPLYDGWLYGDSFFILEPSFWLVLIAPLVFSYRSKAVRAALWLVLVAALGALWYRPLVPRGNALGWAVLTLALLALARRRTPFARMLIASAGFAFVATSFIVGSRLAKSFVREHAQSAFPAGHTLDVVATPMPANPFCWNVLLLQSEGADYTVRLGRAAIWPAWLSLASCPYDRASNPTAPLRALTAGSDAHLILNQEYRIPVAELRAVASEHCAARALLRFARVPYLGEQQADGSRVMGDLRYDRNPGLDFSDVRLTETEKADESRCPDYLPAWLPPRGDLISNP
jgi:inner membrane protein